MKKLSFYLLLLLVLLLTACTSSEKSEGDTSENKTAQGGKGVQKLLSVQEPNFQIFVSLMTREFNRL